MSKVFQYVNLCAAAVLLMAALLDTLQIFTPLVVTVKPYALIAYSAVFLCNGFALSGKHRGLAGVSFVCNLLVPALLSFGHGYPTARTSVLELVAVGCLPLINCLLIWFAYPIGKRENAR